MDRVGRLAKRFVRAALRTHPDDDVVYVGVFLDKMSRKKLLSRFPAVHPTTWAHHMTIWHFAEGTDRPDLPWGRTVTLKVVQHVQGSSAQAVVLDPPTKFRPASRIPHITISTTTGTLPAASNSLLQGEVEPVRGLPGIKGKIGWVDGAGRVHLSPP